MQPQALPQTTRAWRKSDAVAEPVLAVVDLNPQPGTVLLRNVFLVVEPAAQSSNDEELSLSSFGIAEVLVSNNCNWQAGQWVVGKLPWQDCCWVAADQLQALADSSFAAEEFSVMCPALEIKLRKRFKRVVMGLHKAWEIASQSEMRLLQVAIARPLIKAADSQAVA